MPIDHVEYICTRISIDYVIRAFFCVMLRVHLRSDRSSRVLDLILDPMRMENDRIRDLDMYLQYSSVVVTLRSFPLYSFSPPNSLEHIRDT